MRNNEEAVQRDDRWLLQVLEKRMIDRGMGAIYQGYCNALVERPLLAGYQNAEPLLNINGKKVPNARLETEIGPMRGIKMRDKNYDNMILTPFEEADISTEAGRSALIKTAYVSVPLAVDHFLTHIGTIDYAVACGTEMLRKITMHRPEHFEFRITHPSMGLDEPDGFCFLFRMDNQSQFYLMASESGAILTLPQTPYDVIVSMSSEEAEIALAGLHARNPDTKFLHKLHK